MPRMIFTSTILVSALAIGGSGLARDLPSGTTASAVAAPVNACARIKTKGWNAWLNLQPPGPPTLHVEGDATVPSTGWTLTLEPGPLNKMQPPTQTFLFVATPPEKPITAPVVMQQKVNGEIKKALKRYKAVSILCGKSTIATVPVKIIV